MGECMPERFDGGRLLLGIGALALLVSLFLDWFEPELTAWTVFEIVDLLLAATAIGVIFGVVAEAAPGTGLRALPPAAAPVLALVAFVLVVATLINHPPAAVGRSLDTGAWIGLVGAVLMVVGAMLGVGRVSVVVTRKPRSRTGSGRAGSAPDAATSSGVSPSMRSDPIDPIDPEPTRPLGFEERPDADPETRTLPEERS
jgi:hypothetical protein